MFRTRTDRLITIASFLVAVVVLMLLAGAIGAILGPIEFLAVFIVAALTAVLIGRLRSAPRRDRQV